MTLKEAHLKIAFSKLIPMINLFENLVIKNS